MLLSKRDLFEIVFGTNTKAARRFDVILLWVIIASVSTVIIDSLVDVNHNYKQLFIYLEWTFTILFTGEYIIRIYIVPHPRKYIFSIWGLIDLLSILPTYISLIVAGAQFLTILRLMRLLRIFRILNLTRFLIESKILYTAIRASVFKISIFMLFVFVFVIVLGTIMFVIEGGESGFTSIPQSVYWAIITITTVGYGDIVPQTVAGKFIASFIMLIGYSIIAVPTGIFAMEFAKGNKKEKAPRCMKCNHKNPEHSRFCNQCGSKM